jgi:SAM-dependent methyltransferase
MRDSGPRRPTRALDQRDRRLHDLMGSVAGRGLEIGPLFSPIFVPGEADIQYLDLQSAAELREHYRGDPAVKIDEIVDPDFLLIGPDGPRSLPEAVGSAAPFDWVVASHVIEHVPDLIGWLSEVAEILVDDGRVLLAIPDRRFTFDAGRPETTIGEMMLARENGDLTPSVRAVYDHFSSVVAVDIAGAWRGRTFGAESRLHDIGMAMAHVDRRRQGIYVDCHVWLFTPSSLTEQIRELGLLGLCDFVVDRMDPTSRDQQEFYAVLRRLPRELDADARAAVFASPLESRAEQPGPLEPPNAGPPSAADQIHPGIVLSPREERLIEAKRVTLIRAKQAIKRLRR